MNPIAMSLELLLAALLGVTLLFGLRLERKLRALRDSQAGFVRAVQGLDGAAARTESGLEKIREATDEARDALLPRIEAARSAADRLERLTGEAELAAKRAEAAAREVEASAGKLARALAQTRPAAGAAPPPQARALPPEPTLELRPEPRPEPEPKRPAIDFAAMLAARTTRQPLPAHTEEPPVRGETKPAGSRLREAAALLRGG